MTQRSLRWMLKLGVIPILAFIALVNLVHLGIHNTPLDMGALDAGINHLNLIGLYLLDGFNLNRVGGHPLPRLGAQPGTLHHKES